MEKEGVSIAPSAALPLGMSEASCLTAFSGYRVFNPLIALRKLAMRHAFAWSEAQAHLQALMQIVGEKEESPQSPKPSSHESFSGLDHSVFVERLSLPAKHGEVSEHL